MMNKARSLGIRLYSELSSLLTIHFWQNGKEFLMSGMNPESLQILKRSVYSFNLLIVSKLKLLELDHQIILSGEKCIFMEIMEKIQENDNCKW